MKMLVQYGAVAGAGALGAVLRMFVGAVCGRLFGTTFPVGTLVINLSGSLFLGWFIATVRGRGVAVSDTVYAAVAVGFVGAYTTFSTFMYESNALLENGSGIKATVNLLGSLVLGLLAVKAGVRLAGR
jgi:fluoride exporter